MFSHCSLKYVCFIPGGTVLHDQLEKEEKQTSNKARHLWIAFLEDCNSSHISRTLTFFSAHFLKSGTKRNQKWMMHSSVVLAHRHEWEKLLLDKTVKGGVLKVNEWSLIWFSVQLLSSACVPVCRSSCPFLQHYLQRSDLFMSLIWMKTSQFKLFGMRPPWRWSSYS